MTGSPARLRPWGALPERYADQQVISSTIDVSGRILTLVADADVTYYGPKPAPYTATAVIIDGSDVTEVSIPDLDLIAPRIDALGEGFVLASSRCPMPRHFTENISAQNVSQNLRIIDGDGSTRTRFHVGDAVELLTTDRFGQIWVTYFDEASICLPEPAPPGASPQYFTERAVALIRWPATGEDPWFPLRSIDGFRPPWDCIATNVGQHSVWTIPHPNYEFVEIRTNGERRVRASPVGRSSALGIAGDQATFVEGLGYEAADAGTYVVTRCRIEDDALETMSTHPLVLPDGTRPTAWARKRVCRDERIWLQFGEERTWYVLD